MTIATRSASTKQAPGDATRRTALVAGILYLLTFASSIPAALLLSSNLGDSGYIAGADGQIRLAALLDIVNGLTAIGTAVALYSVLKRVHEGFAIGFVASRLFEAAILFIGIVSVVTLANLGQAAATTDASAVAGGASLVAMYKTSFVLGTGIPALNAFLLGWLLYRSGLVPRVIPVIGLIGAPLFTSWIIGYIFGITEGGTAWHAIGVAPIFVWELSLGLWMAFKGFRAPAVAALGFNAADTDEAGTAITAPAAMATKAGAA